MAHWIAPHPDGLHAGYLGKNHPDFDQHKIQVSGELRHVRMWNNDARNGAHHEANVWVPVELVQQTIGVALSNHASRDIDNGDKAWDHAELVSDEHEDGPGGPNQLWDGDDDDAMPFEPRTPDPRGGAKMSLTAAMKVVVATAYIGAATWLGLSTTTPGSGAPTEPTGGSPAYARVAASWGTPNGSTGVTTGTPAAINVPASTTIVGAVYFNASTAGTYEDGATVTSQAFATQGTYTVSPTLTPS